MPSNRDARAAAFLKDIMAGHGLPVPRVDEGDVEAMREAVRAQEGVSGRAVGGPEMARLSVSAQGLNAGLEAVEKGDTLTREQLIGIEAIIIPDKRPAMPLAKGTYTVTHPLWAHLDDPDIKARLTTAARSIGRVEVPGSGLPYGGTAFVVGKGLLMTNRHVAEIFTAGLGLRYLNFLPGIKPGFDSSFAPDNADVPPLVVRGVAMVHPYWDMALLAVEGLSNDAAPLVLEPRDVANFDGEEIAVIGYPAYDYRNDANVQRTVFDNRFGIKQLQPGLLRGRGETESFQKVVAAVTHDCSTLGGNSGSALIHVKSGRVLGLHFGGLYLERNYAVPASELARDGRVFDAGVTFDPSTRPDAPPSWTGYWMRADADEAPPSGKPALAPSPVAQQVKASDPASQVIDLVIPINITVRVGTPTAGGAAVRIGAAGTEIERLAEPERDKDYTSRRGYDAMFLGLRAPPPVPAAPNVVALTRDRRDRLDYQNFSIVMHAARKLALFTASNVTAEPALRRPDPGQDYTRRGLSGLGASDQERWFIDPRLDPEYQLPDAFYTRDDGAFDKGHIVRRDDVAWGATYADLRRANGDTYHVTNCSPQVAGFNRSAAGTDNWGDLENAVLKEAASERLCLFAGPVLADDDIRYLGNFGGGRRNVVQIPSRFWKVVVARAADGLAAFGFVLEQDLSAVPREEYVVSAPFRRFLQPLDDIAAMAGIVFAEEVAAADQFERRGPEVARRAGMGLRRNR